MDKAMEELREEMKREAWEEEQLERKLRTDYEFAFEYFAEIHNLDSAINDIKQFVEDMNKYGWEMTPLEAFDAV